MSRYQKLAFLLLVLGLELFFAIYNPIGEYPDETSHLQNAVFYRNHGRIPDPYKDKFELANGTRVSVQQGKHPPYVYTLGAVVLAATDGWFEKWRPIRLPGAYELSLKPAQRDNDLGIRQGQVLLLRLVLVAHWCVGAWFLLLTMLLVWPERPRFALTIAVLACAIPQVILGGASFTPDTPCSAFSATAIYFLVRAFRDATRLVSSCLLAGVFLGLALLAKSGAIYLIPVIGLLSLQRAMARRRLAEAVRFAALTLGPAALLSGWFYARNWILYGDPFQMQVLIETQAHWINREPLTSAFFEAFCVGMFETFFGFHAADISLWKPMYFVLAGVLGVAATGLLLLARRGVRAAVSRLELELVPAALLALGTLFTLTLLGNLTGFAPQGRYLFPGLPFLAILFGTGLTACLRIRGDGRGWYLLAAAWSLFAVVSFQDIILPRFGVLRSRAAGQGKVLFYEDCGTPGLNPHRVQGYTLPDTAQYGRITSWRTLDGHPEAVVYRFPIAKPRDLQVRVVYFNPDPRTPFAAGVAGKFVYASQRLLANGHMVHDRIELTSTPKLLLYPIPAAWVRSGQLELRFERTSGAAALVNEIWIEEPWLVVDGRKLENRTSLDLPYCAVRRRGDTTQTVEGHLGAGQRTELQDAGPWQVDTAYLSPWLQLEAEGRQVPGVEFLGSMTASGGYRLRGTGALARFDLPADATAGTIVVRVARSEDEWHLETVPTPEQGTPLTYRTSKLESLDYLLVYGILRK